MLGYPRARRAVSRAYFGEGQGQIVLDNVQCEGSEQNLTECRHNGYGVHNCRHSEDAGVECAGQSTGDFDIQLAGGTNAREGRVEIFYNGAWGTVCDDSWDIEDAHVVCRMLGYPRARRAVSRAYFGEGQGQIVLDNVQCEGSEQNLTECRHNGYGVHNCRHSEDAGVECAGQSTGDFDIQLAGGTNAREGRVEIFYDGAWGTVCDDSWDIEDAHVVCRMLGYPRARRAVSRAYFGEGQGQIVLDNVQCEGSEQNLRECRHNGYGVHNCRHSEDAGVECAGQSTGDFDIQLAGGTNAREGRVEIFYDGAWGTVCDDSWDIEDAHVVCRMLGYPRARRAVSRAYFGEGQGQIVLDNVQCEGSEQNLRECRHNGYGVHNCRHSEDAGVECAGQSTGDFDIQLAGGTNAREGRVEIFYDGAWGTVCDDSWDIEDAHVVCRMLGYPRARRAVSRAYFGEGQGQIVLDNVQCEGSEQNLRECRHNGYGVHNCRHSEDAGVECAGQSTGDFDIQLAGGTNAREGRVEIFYDGAWGTVCDDSWDIEDAHVVCRMLGYPRARRAVSRAYFGEGQGQIVLDNVQCEGSEQNLTECRHNGYGVHNCRHSEDAGVECAGE
ncbi:scavenger receptor cysteine-rich domain-containing protein DMBT1-like [Diadema antillarum]|uniref:scavenger receptor cysteine-rich domain-containing protein DMBT1-like n=1 Tax=Diadema antillarum TaxID=105358 RepID=UPI003A83D6CC